MKDMHHSGGEWIRAACYQTGDSDKLVRDKPYQSDAIGLLCMQIMKRRRRTRSSSLTVSFVYDDPQRQDYLRLIDPEEELQWKR